jgi:UPF0755 protein
VKIKTPIIVVLAAIIVWVAVTLAGDYYGWFRSASTIPVDIPAGASLRDISNVLAENKIISNRTLFRLSARSHASDFKAGEHTLQGNMSYNQIIAALLRVPIVEGVKVVIPEGFEIRQIAARLEANGLANAQEFMRIADSSRFDEERYPFLRGITRREHRLEGYLFPATYTIMPGATEHDIISLMLDTFNRNFTQSHYDQAQAMGMTVDEVITLASIVEREAAGDIDRAKVASVFHNRLNSRSFPYLQSCATVQFVLKERRPILLFEDLRIQSPYNTYANPGLPIGPIASPGMASINATLNPAATSYFFFVVNVNGTHTFSRTLEEHNAATPR